MFIETSAAIIVLAPILVPVARHFGIDPVHFGMIMVVNLAMGMITPPFGVNLFAACTVAKISLDRIIGHLLPFVAVIIGLPDADHLHPVDQPDAARHGVRAGGGGAGRAGTGDRAAVSGAPGRWRSWI